MKTFRPPPCPRAACGSSDTQLVGYAVMTDHIIDCYVCHACTRSFNVRSDDPRDSRFREMRAEGPTAAPLTFDSSF